MVQLVLIDIVCKAASYFFYSAVGEESLALVGGVHDYMRVRIGFLIMKRGVPSEIFHFDFLTLSNISDLPLD